MQCGGGWQRKGTGPVEFIFLWAELTLQYGIVDLIKSISSEYCQTKYWQPVAVHILLVTLNDEPHLATKTSHKVSATLHIYIDQVVLPYGLTLGGELSK